MPIHYSELQKGKTKHVSPVSPCPSSEGKRAKASTGGRIHTLSFQTIPDAAIPPRTSSWQFNTKPTIDSNPKKGAL